MAEFLVIRLGDNPQEMAHWIAVDGNGGRLSPPVAGPIATAAQDVGDKTVIVLVPAAAVLTTSVDLPIKSGSRLRAALPFALEEQLADDVENLHFAAGQRQGDGLLPVAVVAHEQMQAWQAVLREAGIKAAQMLPETNGLAKIPGTLSLLVAEGQVIFNDGAQMEFAMQGVKPSDALAVTGVFDDNEASGHLLVYCEASDEADYQHDWNVLRHELNSVDLSLLPDGVLPRLAVTVAAKGGVNLLQGPYGPTIEYGPLIRPWRSVAALLAAVLVVGFVAKTADYYRLKAEQAELQSQFTALYREMRPNDTTEIADPRRYVEAIRRSLGTTVATEAFLPGMQELSTAMQQNSAAEIEAISYRAGVVDVRLTAPDVATLDSIQKLVSTSGRFTASIQSTDQVGDKISSRIQIRESGA